jgi:hypothetical protein
MELTPEKTQSNYSKRFNQRRGFSGWDLARKVFCAALRWTLCRRQVKQ